jgi:hypothetical protein
MRSADRAKLVTIKPTGGQSSPGCHSTFGFCAQPANSNLKSRFQSSHRAAGIEENRHFQEILACLTRLFNFATLRAKARNGSRAHRLAVSASALRLGSNLPVEDRIGNASRRVHGLNHFRARERSGEF